MAEVQVDTESDKAVADSHRSTHRVPNEVVVVAVLVAEDTALVAP